MKKVKPPHQKKKSSYTDHNADNAEVLSQRVLPSSNNHTDEHNCKMSLEDGVNKQGNITEG